MTVLSVNPPYPILTDSDGQPLEDGYVWIGQANLDPQTNPIAAYWDAGLTQLAAQPIRTLNGYPANNGTPARIFVNSDFSIKVANKRGSFVYSSASNNERNSSEFFTFIQSGAGAVERTAQNKMRDKFSAQDFGAVGDGIANETSIFKLIETTSASNVDLCNRSYVLTSVGADPVNGIRLTKNYTNGQLIVDGRPMNFDVTSGEARSGAAKTRMIEPSTNKKIGLYRLNENSYYVWRPLGNQYWQRSLLSRSSNTVPFNWNETYLKQVLGYICAQDDGVTYNGTWAVAGGTTALSSSDPDTYISGRARQATAAADYVEITYDGGGDLYVVFVGRTSGNYVEVMLDSDTQYLVLPDDGSGNKYFDSYTSTDLKYKQVVKIAQAVPSGSHTVRLTVLASKNPSSSGGRFIFNALSFDSDEMGPWQPQADAPAWETGEAVLQNQVRKSFGRYYYALGSGTTGATAPTWSSGSGSDGTVSWQQRDASGYDLLDHRIQAAGSQLEYAYQIKPSGAASREDVGGALHGNEIQTSMALYVGGTQATLADFEWRVGDWVGIKENITATHSQIGGGTTPVVLTVLVRNFLRQSVEIRHKHTLQFSSELGYFYSHMWPLLHYSSVGQKYGLQSLWSPSDGYRLSSSYYGQTNPFVGRVKDLIVAGYGSAFQPNGGGGVPATTPAPLQFVAWLAVDPDSVDNFKDAREFFCAKDMNTSGADVAAGGYSSMTSKIYFERYSGLAPVGKPAGYQINCVALYGLALVPPM